MPLKFVGIDPVTNGDNCPTVWVDEATCEIVIQGWTADTDTRAECLATGPIPDHETVLRLPARMAPILIEACDVAGGLRPGGPPAGRDDTGNGPDPGPAHASFRPRRRTSSVPSTP